MFIVVFDLLPVIAYMIIPFLGTVAISDFKIIIVFEAEIPKCACSVISFDV